jgi:hypothetical protein
MRGTDHQQSGMFSYISAGQHVPRDLPLRTNRRPTPICAANFRIVRQGGQRALSGAIPAFIKM